MKLLHLCAVAVTSLLLGACSPSGDQAQAPSSPDAPEYGVQEIDGVKKKTFEGFDGVIAERYEDSEEWWAPYVEPKADAPNVIIFLLDDTGFAQIGSFGGLIETPNIDQLANNGLRFNNFHTTALCSPTRASLMAGRFPHSIGLGSHALTAMGFPGYNAVMPASAKSVANYLGEAGYINYALGKWDHTPLYEVSQVGPFDRWPSGEGFDHSYVFMAADVHQLVPVMWNDHTPEPYRKSVHLDQDLADRAIEWITGHKSIKPELPFMMLWASGSMHSPHHAPDSHIDKYKGKFDMGWDKAREQIIARQLELGIIPANTGLTDRIDAIPAWDPLPDEEKELYARQMEVFAAQLEWVDMQIGRVVTERGIAGHRPARVIVRVGVFAPPVLEIAQVGRKRCLQAIQHIGFIERAGQATFTTGAVVRRNENQRVVQFADAFEFLDDTANLQVDPFHLRGKYFHLARVQFFLVVRQ
jgi:hypothetical protein